MDCRTFQKNHVAYVDDVLPAYRMSAMRDHLAACPVCARHDSRERRALMLVRSLPRIEPSAGFSARLDARLRQPAPLASLTPGLTPGRSSFVAMALAAMLVFAVMTASAISGRAVPLVHPPVFAVLAEPPIARGPALADGALVASVSTGMPMLPMALLAEQAPMHFANAEFHLASFSR